MILTHTVYTGSFAALEKRWTEIVGELRLEDPLSEINVLVGSNILASYLKQLSVRTGQALANVRFHTFLDLVTRIAADAGITPRKKRIPDLGTSIVLEEILAARMPETFAPLAEFSGFRDALIETFRDLRDAEVTPDRFDQALVSGPEMKERKEHLAALADLYRRYRARVGVMQDVDDDFRAAISECSRAAGMRGMRQLMVYGIYDVTEQQARLLSALKDSVALVYFVPYVNETVSGFSRPFLLARSLELGVEPVSLADPAPGSELERLAARGFGLAPPEKSGAPEPPGSDGSLALVSVPGESRLAVEVVREIVRAVRDGTIGGFHEAAVVLRQPEADIPVLAETMRLRGISYYIHGGEPFSNRLISRTVAALLDLASGPFSRESILTVMELVAALKPEAESSGWNVPDWRAMTSDARFLAGVRSWDSGIDSLLATAAGKLRRSEGIETGNIGEIEEGSGRQDREDLRKRFETARSLQQGWRQIRRAAADWPRTGSWKEWAEFLALRLEPILGFSEDWHSFQSVLDKIGNLHSLGDRQVSLDTMKAALIRSIQSVNHPEGSFLNSGVNILSTSAARGLRFPLVVIPGLDEGRFPARLRQDPLLLDPERRRLENLPLKKKRLDEERLLFDMTARSAGRRLVLMTSRLEESSDRERIPSQFFLRAAAAVRGDAVNLRELAPDTVPGFRSVSLDNPAPRPDEPAVDEGEVRLRMVCSGMYGAQAAIEALSRLEPFRFNRPVAYDRARRARSLTPYDGHIRDPKLAEWMAGTLPSVQGQVSASRLEAYAKCPYYYFLKYGMELEAWEEPEPADAIDARARGLAVHSVAERFLKEHGGESLRSAPEEELSRSLESLAGEIIGQARPAGIPDLLWEIECEGLTAMLRNWLAFERSRADAGLRPAGLELVFGEFPGEERFPAFCVEAGKHRFRFRGRIDRVDVSPDGTRARVVDYKTGMLPPSMAGRSRTPLMGGERIQLAVYAGALTVLEAFRAVRSVEGEYLHLEPRDGRIRASAFSGEELEQASGLLPGILEILGDGMESGVFFARTSGTLRPAGHCDYCEYLTICGKDRIQREERKTDDPRVRIFLRIVEKG